ncbi:hypothetical protein BUALT_Bualt15G0000700 [Buddleja alternifolia]|uniref:non-specific serine/threonine protein kinase n=1 Tax=Buddleja alternifolia TaxID=168488 RepID=A0AAV6WBF4_9LAMI|nr:hypothetical protein BUALT_Bualt15G0000700 [Buddleja alternifolia]
MKTCNSVVILFLFTLITAAANTNLRDHEISISCGSTGSSSSAALTGKQWRGDAYQKFVTLKGSSSSSSSSHNSKIISSLDPSIPYNTARISRSQFSYSFQLNPGQKFIRLHFNPSNSYNGFQSFNDLFTVEAGPFTLLTNFSASITAHALAVNTFVKEFCVSIQQNQSLDIIFTPSHTSYAFINGIEIISLPSSLSYCLGGDIGVQVVGQKSVVYIDNATALEMVHQLNVKQDHSVLSPVDDMFGMWKTLLKEKEKKANNNNITWKISVDVGFRYLVRLHFCEVGLQTKFMLLINHMIANTNADVLQEREVNGVLWYRNHLVEVKGRKEEGKRDILISLHSEHGENGNGPLEGFEIFKLSNHDNSLASPNPLPPIPDSPAFHAPIQKKLLSLLGHRNAIATLVTAFICLVNIIVHMLQQHWEANSTEEENKPSTSRSERLCRRFSLSQIQSATEIFNDAFVIGKGGFGKVYKGFIDNADGQQQIVAIKRLKPNSKQGKREFWTEIEMLSELRHVNLVSLIGYCNEQREMILVYDYMCSGTLADHLYKLARKNNNCSSLSWKQRLQICIGAGRGLDYLHTGHGVVHRDVKASNILLDENFVAKVSDFGLAKTENGDSTNLKGTFGYFDPDYFRTRKLTTKSDTYSFGVVLLEVLCGRPAVDPFVEEDKRSLTMWARENISKGGDVDQIVAPSLRGEILPDSLMAFIGVAEKCLHDEPKKRPTIAHVIINLEFALEQQENALSLVPYDKTSIADFFPFTDKTQQQDNTKSMTPNEITSRADVLPCTYNIQEENSKSLSPNEITSVANVLPFTDRTIFSSMRQLNTVSSNVQSVTCALKEQQTNSKMVNSEPPYRKKEGRKMLHKLSRLWPWDAVWSSKKPSKKKNFPGFSISAPIAHRNSNKMFPRGRTVSGILKSSAAGGSNELTVTPNLRIFSFSELKAATRNFRNDTVLGEGGFGRVYKGWLDDKSTTKFGSRSAIAVKKLNLEGLQGFKEWQSEVKFLGRLSHPNLVKLLGYCSDDNEMLLVYEFMQKGSLENHLFPRTSAGQPLEWDFRVKIIIGAAHGLAFLHATERKVIYRDFKASNILLDESYNPKLSDFGLAKLGPTAAYTHVSTQVIGTYGYAAPEYIATGHLNAKSDVYGFGVVLLEMLTGLQAIDENRPPREHNLVDWMKTDVG